MKSPLKSAFLLSLLASAALAAPVYAADTAASAKLTADAAAKAADAAPAKPVKDYTILKLNGQDIKESEIEEVWKTLFPNNAPDFNSFDDNIKQNVLRGLVSEKLIYQEALKAGYDKTPEVKKRLEQLQKQVVMQSFMESKAKEAITDQQLHTAYAEKIAQMKDKEEFHARHILVPTEDEAKDVEKQLKKGGDFAKIAKEKSKDPGSATQGGDLGWFTADKMVKPFADAVAKMKKGDVSEPIKTDFGWHVIKLEERRKVTPPTFEAMQDSLREELTRKALQSYVEGMLAKADITYYGPDGKPRDFSRSLTPPASEAPSGDKLPAVTE